MVYLGLDQAVILYGYDVVKTVLVDRGQEFLDRGSFPTSNKSNGELGIFMSNGERWAQLRRFSLTTLRNFGMGKKSLEERIQEEAQHLVEALRARKARIHEEIDRVVGKVRPPAMKDRSQMPYTEAAIHEAQRFLDLIPLGFVRMARQDVQLAGFTIPKGATIYPILSSVLNDPKQYKNPSRFDPEHFLDENGDFKKSSADMPFSAGKRNCLGEGLARMELFLFLTTILQSFRLMHPPGVAQINLTPEVSGVGHIPRQASFCFCPR
uniref:Uncharacterized protein n=1 Tax=Varanus komodoensis TaxID=61221 RepID=A0A8D2L2N7_VARKO